MTEQTYDLVAVGGGTAGLVSAAGASYVGARSALIEREALGGDCLWTGCVPSKALIASARLAHAMRHADRLGLRGTAPAPALAEVMARMRAARRTVAHHDDPERFRAMGVGVHHGDARFLDADRLEVEGVGRIRSRRIVLATGAVPSIPPVEGLEEAGFLTHQTVFDLDTLPERLVVMGAGPVGLELAQVFARLGARVTVLEMRERILPAEDREAAAALQEELESEGVTFLLGERAERVEREGSVTAVTTACGRRVVGEALLVATGRRPATGGLELERAGVEVADGGGVVVDERLRTTSPHVWAAGDVTGGLQFTHVADYMARTVVRNALVPGHTTVDYGAVPRVTYTDPELAHVGLGREAAEAEGGETYRYDFADLDRAIVDAETTGFVQVHANGKGRILGATILGSRAGELLLPVVMAMKHGLSLSQISDTVFPYPTHVEGVKRAADAYRRGKLDGLGGKILRKVVGWLA